MVSKIWRLSYHTQEEYWNLYKMDNYHETAHMQSMIIT